MNRFFVTSAIVGSSLGVFHGRTYRTTQSYPQEIMCCTRDAVIGAAIYPFILPIAAYQLFINAPPNWCVYKIMMNPIKKSSPSSETSALQ